MKGCTALLLTFMALGLHASAQESNRVFDCTIPKLEFRKVPASEAFRFIEKELRHVNDNASEVSFLIAKDVSRLDPPVVLSASEIRAKDALRIVANMTGYVPLYWNQTVILALRAAIPSTELVALSGTCVDATTGEPVADLNVQTFWSRFGGHPTTFSLPGGRFVAFVPSATELAYLGDVEIRTSKAVALRCEFSAPGYQTQTNEVSLQDMTRRDCGWGPTVLQIRLRPKGEKRKDSNEPSKAIP